MPEFPTMPMKLPTSWIKVCLCASSEAFLVFGLLSLDSGQVIKNKIFPEIFSVSSSLGDVFKPAAVWINQLDTMIYTTDYWMRREWVLPENSKKRFFFLLFGLGNACSPHTQSHTWKQLGQAGGSVWTANLCQSIFPPPINCFHEATDLFMGIRWERMGVAVSPRAGG